jgi:hypothetical protein
MKSMALASWCWCARGTRMPKRPPVPRALMMCSARPRGRDAGRALHGCGYVAATTSRERDQRFRIVDVRGPQRGSAAAQRAPAAVVFAPSALG